MTRLWARGWLCQAVDATLAPQRARDVLIAGQSNAGRVDDPTVLDSMSGTVRTQYETAGGTGFQNGWDPDESNGVYAVASGDILAGMKNPKAVGWVQGEHDAGHVTFSAEYGANMARLLGYWWTRAEREVEVFAVKLHSGCTKTYTSTVRAQQDALAARFRNFHLVVCDNITDYDGLHYGTTGELYMSARLASAMETAR